MQQICASIVEFTFTNPSLIMEDNSLIADHDRLMAAQRLRLKEVPCIQLDHLTDLQRHALIIGDYKIALNSGRDEAKLEEEITDIQHEEFDVDLLSHLQSRAVGLEQMPVQGSLAQRQAHEPQGPWLDLD